MAKSLKQGESMPPPLPGVVLTGIFSFMFMLAPVSLAVLLEPVVKPEQALQSFLDLPDPLAMPIFAALFHFFVVQWLAMLVNSARSRFSVPWPQMYAEQSHPHAVQYNCAQRAHQHVLEQTPILLTLLGIGSLEYPLTSGVAAALFSLSKIVGNVLGYSRGRSSAKNRGAFGYVGLLTLVGLVGLVGLRRSGKVDAFTSKIEDAVEAAKPIVNITIAKTYEAVEAAKPHVAKARAACEPFMVRAYEAAVPYVEAAAPYVEPHVTKAREAAAPYMTSAFEAAAPYVEPCSDAIAHALGYTTAA